MFRPEGIRPEREYLGHATRPSSAQSLKLDHNSFDTSQSLKLTGRISLCIYMWVECPKGRFFLAKRPRYSRHEFACSSDMPRLRKLDFARDPLSLVTRMRRRAPSLVSELSRTKSDVLLSLFDSVGTKTSWACRYFPNGASFTVLSVLTLAPNLASHSLRARFRYDDCWCPDRRQI